MSTADDRETPIEAFRDIISLLRVIGDKTGDNPSIYDPYYCKGGMKQNLSLLGYENVFNDDVDCYKVWKKREEPDYDVLITNPPYSGDHIRRALSFALKQKKPFAMLLPSNVFLRSWYSSVTKNHPPIVFVAPHSRYAFKVQEKEKAPHVPFVTMWFIGYVHGSSLLKEMRALFNELNQQATLAATVDELPRRIKKILPYTLNRADKKGLRN